MLKKLSSQVTILQNRTAYALFLKKGLDEVERLYPDSTVFVKKKG